MTCPICQRDMVAEHRPFCSRRCADVDLARWMNGGYAMPSEREEDQDLPDDADPTTH